MTYKLAKQLKDAGFPFKTTNFGPNEKVEKAFFLDKPYGMGYIEPTLSELIEACGDRLTVQKIEGNVDHFNYIAWIDIGTNPMKYASSTPEEVVAKLWLKINVK